MKIAFVWKWGSWKSTMSSLFIQYLVSEKVKFIWIDADINISLLPDLWIEIDKSKALSSPNNVKLIRNYLIWNNKKIWWVEHFVKTTPPWVWSSIFTMKKLDVLEKLLSKIWTGYIWHVWTYDSDWIWKSCYHNNLSILENILSHTYLKSDEYFIVDMVAWTDSFSNSLHAQFDLIFLIVDPYPESLSVANNFISLSWKAESLDTIRVIWNKIEDDDDLKYISNNLKLPLFSYFPYSRKLKKSRQFWKNISLDDLWDNELKNLSAIYSLRNNVNLDNNRKLELLHNLHMTYCSQDYIKRRLWDISNQIDKDFSYEKVINE